jgi:hypothetical protein
MYAWNSEQQSLDPAPTPGGQGPAVQFRDSTVVGSALSFTSLTEINILESGYYTIKWTVYKTSYDSAFALFFDSDGTGSAMLPGSNHGSMAEDAVNQGQAVVFLTAGGTLTLNRIDDLHTLTILNQISGDTSVTGASIVIVKIG